MKALYKTGAAVNARDNICSAIHPLNPVWNDVGAPLSFATLGWCCAIPQLNLSVPDGVLLPR